MQPLNSALSATFEMKDLGEAEYLLGISIQRDRDRRTLSINQGHYIREMLMEQRIPNSRRVTTPADGYTCLTQSTPGEPPTDIAAYQRLLGKLNWTVRGCRPDVGFATQKLSQFAHNPAVRHMVGAQRVLRYLGETEHAKITFSKGELVGYTDADYAADESRKSTMGFVFMLGGGAITWSSKLQRSVSTSTTEAEYHALSYASKEAVWIASFLQQIGRPVRGPVPVYSDNEGAIALVKNPEFHARTKHIDVSVHYVRELAEDGKVNIQHTPTESMLADCLTKPLKAVQHMRNMEGIGLWCHGI